MNIHEMKLQPEYYNFIINGTKRIELRLNDEKRQLLNIGDIIEFKKLPDLKESFKVKVVDLLKYNTFLDLINDFDVKVLADESVTKEELLEILQQFYSKKEQAQYGVLGIKIEII